MLIASLAHCAISYAIMHLVNPDEKLQFRFIHPLYVFVSYVLGSALARRDWSDLLGFLADPATWNVLVVASSGFISAGLGWFGCIGVLQPRILTILFVMSIFSIILTLLAHHRFQSNWKKTSFFQFIMAMIGAIVPYLSLYLLFLLVWPDITNAPRSAFWIVLVTMALGNIALFIPACLLMERLQRTSPDLHELLMTPMAEFNDFETVEL